ncbi:hypothetical protein [Aliivibrio logei]
MQLTKALTLANDFVPDSDSLGKLSDILPPEFINQCLSEWHSKWSSLAIY